MDDAGTSPTVFISYRREDAAAHAGRIADQLLSRFGTGSVFMDVDSIVAGSDFVTEIGRAVSQADAVLVVIGPEWLLASDPSGGSRLQDPADFVRLEIETALASDRRVIPVLVGGASMPAPEQLPESISRLARLSAIEIQDRRWRGDFEALVDALAPRVAQDELAPPQLPEEAARLRQDIQPAPLLLRRKKALLVTAAVLAAGVVAIVLYPRHSPEIPETHPLNNVLVEIDAKTNQAIRIVRGIANSGMGRVISPPFTFGEGRMWLVQGSYLLPVDAGTGVKQAPIALGGTVDFQDTVAVGFGKVWLALNGLTRVDLDTYKVLAPIKKIPGLGNGLANDSGGGVVAGYGGVWTTATGGVARVNGLTGKLVEIISVDGSFDYMAIGAGGVWVADKLAGTVTRIDPKTDTAGAPISIGGNIDGIAAGGGAVWVLDSAGTVTPIDSSTNLVRPQIRVGSDPVDISFGLAAVWVADQASGTIWRIDPDTRQVVSIKVGGPVAAVAVDRANHSLWAAVMPNQSSRVG